MIKDQRSSVSVNLLIATPPKKGKGKLSSWQKSFTSYGKIPREVSSYPPIDTGSQGLYLPWVLYFKKKVLLRDAPGL